MVLLLFIDSSGEMDPGQTERLFPEYDYENEVIIGDDREEPPSAAAGGDYNTEAIRAENDWRQHAASTPHKGFVMSYQSSYWL